MFHGVYKPTYNWGGHHPRWYDGPVAPGTFQTPGRVPVRVGKLFISWPYGHMDPYLVGGLEHGFYFSIYWL